MKTTTPLETAARGAQPLATAAQHPPGHDPAPSGALSALGMLGARWRGRSPRPAPDAKAGGTIVARLSDGPLSGSSRDVVAVEGRPPKTIDVSLEEHVFRYCLAEWEQSGHSAIYGFLYEV